MTGALAHRQCHLARELALITTVRPKADGRINRSGRQFSATGAPATLAAPLAATPSPLAFVPVVSSQMASVFPVHHFVQAKI